MKKQRAAAALILAAIFTASAIFAPAAIIQAIIPAAVPTANKRGNGSIFALATSTTPASAGTGYCDDGNGNITTSGCGSGIVTSVFGQTGAVGNLTGAVTTSNSTATTLASQYSTFSCQGGMGDGLNAITAGTYLQGTCINKFGVTYTITSIQCWTDNNGTSTLNATNGAGTGLLTGAVTCTNTFPGASGTQSGTTTIASNDGVKFTFVADGTTNQATFVLTGTR